MEYGGTVIEEEDSFTAFDEGIGSSFEDEDIILLSVVEYSDIVIGEDSFTAFDEGDIFLFKDEDTISSLVVYVVIIVVWEDSVAEEKVEDSVFFNEESVAVTVMEAALTVPLDGKEIDEGMEATV